VKEGYLYTNGRRWASFRIEVPLDFKVDRRRGCTLYEVYERTEKDQYVF